MSDTSSLFSVLRQTADPEVAGACAGLPRTPAEISGELRGIAGKVVIYEIA